MKKILVSLIEYILRLEKSSLTHTTIKKYVVMK